MFFIANPIARKIILAIILLLLIFLLKDVSFSQELEIAQEQEQVVDEIGKIEASALDKHREKEAKALGLPPTLFVLCSK